MGLSLSVICTLTFCVIGLLTVKVINESPSALNMPMTTAIFMLLHQLAPAETDGYSTVLVNNPWVHGLNKSRVPSHNGGTIYRVAI